MAARGSGTVSARKREKGREADYGEATPEQVAEAVLKYRRKAPQPNPQPPVNPNI